MDAVEASAAARAAARRTGSSASPRRRGCAPSSSGGGSPASVRIRNAPGALVGDHRHGRPPALGVVEPGQHLRAWARGPGSARAAARRLRHARVGGHAPVLAAPVEPALRQPLDGLVQVLVEREVEDELGPREDCRRAARPGPETGSDSRGVGSTAKQTSLAPTEAFGQGHRFVDGWFCADLGGECLRWVAVRRLLRGRPR